MNIQLSTELRFIIYGVSLHCSSETNLWVEEEHVYSPTDNTRQTFWKKTKMIATNVPPNPTSHLTGCLSEWWSTAPWWGSLLPLGSHRSQKQGPHPQFPCILLTEVCALPQRHVWLPESICWCGAVKMCLESPRLAGGELRYLANLWGQLIDYSLWKTHCPKLEAWASYFFLWKGLWFHKLEVAETKAPVQFSGEK